MEIILYSNNCPRCNVLKRKLTEASVPYTLVEDENTMIEMGFMEAPILIVDNVEMNFTDAMAWLREM